MLADDRDGLGRSHVVAGIPVVVSRGAEIFFHDLLSARESVSSAHGEIMPDGRVLTFWKNKLKTLRFGVKMGAASREIAGILQMAEKVQKKWMR